MEAKEQKKRITIYLLLTAVVFLVFVGRLYYFQIVKSSQFVQKSHENRTRIVEIPARRGDIKSADGSILATSKPIFSVQIPPLLEGEELEKTAQKLSSIIGEDKLTTEEIIEKAEEPQTGYVPVEVVQLRQGEETWEIISKIEERRDELPGVIIEEYPRRTYPHNQIGGHILGYVGQISENEFDNKQEMNYSINDRIGKTGIERFAELLEYSSEQVVGLRGQKGVKRVEVDANNRQVQELITIPPNVGDTVQLTVDKNIQQTLENSMDQVIKNTQEENEKAMAGGAILLDVNTGAVLAAASMPEMDPNDFVDGSYSEKSDYYNDPAKLPLYNRVFQAEYPPGSTFKMITGMAALEEGLDPNETINCKGAYWEPPYIRCWDVHGHVNLYEAIGVSCNTYFQEMGRRAGIDKIVEVAEEFGLAEKTDTLGVLSERSGLLASPEWKANLYERTWEKEYESKLEQLEEEYEEKLEEARNEEEEQEIEEEYRRRKQALESQHLIEKNFYGGWQPYETSNVSIGQGSNSFTIAQLANYTATIANGGKRYRPYLVDSIINRDGKTEQEFGSKVIDNVSVSPVNLAHVRKGMQQVTESGGTAHSLFRDFPEEVSVAAKTGTAQTGRGGDRKREDFHGVFVAFAPADEPEIAFAGVIEYADSGTGSAGRVAKAVFEEYFGLNQEEEE